MGDSIPKSLAMTQFHFVILSTDRVMALNSLLGKEAYTEMLLLVRQAS
jgi:hypothetical protein